MSLTNFSGANYIALYYLYLFALKYYYVQDEAALLQAAASGDVAAVRRLIQSQINVNATDKVCGREYNIKF